MSAETLNVMHHAIPFSEFGAAGWTGDVQISIRDDARLELRYFDDPERFRCWVIPLCYVIDLVRWWSHVGCTHRSSDRATAEASYGAINVSVPSRNQIYFRGRSPLGRPNITGFQLPRPAVEALCTYVASRTAESDAADLATGDEQGSQIGSQASARLGNCRGTTGRQGA